MKLSLTIILAVVAFAYSTGCVLYYECTKSPPPDFLLYPIAPGIWVGGQVDRLPNSSMMSDYVAGIGTMTVLGALLGSVFEWLGSGRRATTG